MCCEFCNKHKPLLTPLNERGWVINHDWIKKAQKALRGILGRG